MQGIASGQNSDSQFVPDLSMVWRANYMGISAHHAGSSAKATMLCVIRAKQLRPSDAVSSTQLGQGHEHQSSSSARRDGIISSDDKVICSLTPSSVLPGPRQPTSTASAMPPPSSLNSSISTQLLAGVLAVSMSVAGPATASSNAPTASTQDQSISTLPLTISSMRWQPPVMDLQASPAPSLLSQQALPMNTKGAPVSEEHMQPSACDTEKLAAIFRQLALGEGFETSSSPTGVYQFYRRLGCTEQQLTEALSLAFNSLPSEENRNSLVPSAVSALMSPPNAMVIAVETGIAAALLLTAKIYRERPRGWARRDLLEVRSSDIAGIGLFARAAIPDGTVLGCYPGVPRTAAEIVAKVEVAPGTKQFVFCTDRGLYLDPTDAMGIGPSPYPAPGPWWPLEVQIELAYANEPPAGSSGPNCCVKDGADEAELLFVATRDIRQGEEVLIDYGSTYDRSGYGKR